MARLQAGPQILQIQTQTMPAERQAQEPIPSIMIGDGFLLPVQIYGNPGQTRLPWIVAAVGIVILEDKAGDGP